MQKSTVERVSSNQKKEESFERMSVSFGENKDQDNQRKAKNSVRTSKYTWITWAPLSLFYQFTRAANIYFLWISILTCMPFSPKAPASMIGTFSGVLIFTMFKELFEDYYRMKSDKQINNSKTRIYNYTKKDFETVSWKDVKQGDIIKVEKDESFPADILFLHSKTDVIFVDTMNLDGETNLKPKVLASSSLIPSITKSEESKLTDSTLPPYCPSSLHSLTGRIDCEFPNENLEQWDANLCIHSTPQNPENLKINNMLLRGCVLRNTPFVVGVVVYVGKESKIMKNAKKAPRKVSNLMKMMDYMLYTVFLFQIVIIMAFASVSVGWISEKGRKYEYLDMGDTDVGPITWVVQLLTYWVAYSHMIPISLYVIIEVLKLVQSYLVKWDEEMYDRETEQFAECRNSDLVEELGQIDFIFSDKTGTLTCNKMVFKRCSVGGKVFSTDEEASKESSSTNYKQSDQLSSSRDRECLSNNDVEESKMDMIDHRQINQMPMQDIEDHEEGEEKGLKDERKQSKDLTEFFKFMVLCHAVMVDRDPKTDQIIYQSSSPDESALVEGSKEVGIVLKDRTKDTMTISIDGEEEAYEICIEFPFDSTRKRMSVVIQKNNKYYLLTKGADNIMNPRINWKEGEKEKIESDLHQFAIEGLRTLVMAQKEITHQTFIDLKNRIDELEASTLVNKEEMIFDVYDQYEGDLNFVGASAIEDKLQDKVADTISILIEANIRVWVLTGDKQETAIEIAKACQLIQKGMEEEILTIDFDNIKLKEPTIIIHDEIKRIYDKYGIKHTIDDVNGDDTKTRKKKMIPFKDAQETIPSLSIVIDGPTLGVVLGDEELEFEFFKLAILAKSVICCRVSPKQKALIVKLAKYKEKSISLSIGDGANDVPMIMEANIGIGIRGKEGTQAVRASDYAISQFRFLQRLILVHGRYGYRRISSVVCYYFYKNILLVFTEIYFAVFCGFSGQIYFADWLPMLYNSLWTSFTCFFAYSLERDIPTEESEKSPHLYSAGQKREYFSYLKFWKWIILSIYHGLIVYFGCTCGFRYAVNLDGHTETLWFVSSTAFTIIVHLVTFKLLIELLFLNWIVIAAGIGSVILYWLCALFLNSSYVSSILQPNLEGIYFRMLTSVPTLLSLLLVPCIALLPDMTLKYFSQLFNPSDSDTSISEHKEIQKLKEKKTPRKAKYEVAPKRRGLSNHFNSEARLNRLD
ncbi:unnamed protein product [Moneuplotes crassus]|uniref:Phospholipid-transporting ATPase n=2 Tax=Euplotes crassus TaxID=5936 RepID=A0AAD1XD64_EUPCR|nr:unnamed protein product [Moneuplotes crassus]